MGKTISVVTLNYRELTTVLAALRAFQEEPRPDMEHFLDVKPLTAGQIDSLC